MCCPIGGLKTLEIGLLRAAKHSKGATCCPMGFEQGAQIEPTPQHAPNHGEDAYETVLPATHKGREACSSLSFRFCPFESELSLRPDINKDHRFVCVITVRKLLSFCLPSNPWPSRIRGASSSNRYRHLDRWMRAVVCECGVLVLDTNDRGHHPTCCNRRDHGYAHALCVDVPHGFEEAAD